jgi:nicotinamidase-related amidase
MSDTHEGQLNGLGEMLDPAHTALVVVDMQNDFCAENGYIHNAQGVDMSGNKPLAARIGKLVEAARNIGVMVVWIKAIYDHDLLPAAHPVPGGQISTRSDRLTANRWSKSAAIRHFTTPRWTTSCAAAASSRW